MLKLKSRIAATLCALAAAPAAADEVPRAREGSQNAAIYNGEQNMPVVLYGVAREWARDCAQGRADKCIELGDAFELGLGDTQPAPRVAAGYFLSACRHGHDVACTVYASMALGGTLSLDNPEAAVFAARKGCEELGSKDTCAWLGVLYQRGFGVPRDIAKAETLWYESCDDGWDDGCRFYTRHSLEKPGISQTVVDNARAIYTNFCNDLTSAWACMGLAELEGVSTPEGVQLLRKACIEGEGDKRPACALYGEQIIASRDKQTLDLAEGLLDSTCDAGISRSCLLIGRHGYSPNAQLGDVTEGEAGWYLRRGCDLANAEACYDLGLAYLNSKFRAFDLEPGIMLMKKACELGHRPGCTMIEEADARGEVPRILAQMIDPSLPSDEILRQAIAAADGGRPERARLALIMLNDEQNEDAQWVLGNYFLTGKPGVVPANRGNAVTSIENAARKGHVEAARWMGMAHWMGTHGVEADRGLGLGYMRIAARFGDPDSLMLLRSMELQPERDRIAAQRREDARRATEREQRSWFARWGEAIAADASRSSPYRTGISASQRAANQGWQNSQAAMDRLHFNQRMDYLTGASTACNRSNPYC